MKHIISGLLLTAACHATSAGELQVHFKNTDGEPIIDAVIEIISPKIPIPADWNYSGVMDQVDKEFINNVVTIVAGSEIIFPNSDDIQHHVYSFSDNKTFELPLYTGNQAEPILFPDPGVAVVGCNIHDWMLGYIYVGSSHLLAKSNELGISVLNDLDPGEYTFKIWHERARRGDQFSTFDVQITDTGVSTIEVELKLARDRRIRRAPTGSGKSYH